MYIAIYVPIQNIWKLCGTSSSIWEEISWHGGKLALCPLQNLVIYSGV